MPPPFGAATGLRGVPGPPDDGVSTAWTGAARARTWGCFAAAGIYLFSNGPDDKSVKLALRDNCHERLLALTPEVREQHWKEAEKGLGNRSSGPNTLTLMELRWRRRSRR
jgi:hypothetical protein